MTRTRYIDQKCHFLIEENNIYRCSYDMDGAELETCEGCLAPKQWMAKRRDSLLNG